MDISATQIPIAEIRSVYYRRPAPPTVPEAIADPIAAWMSSETRRTWGGVLSASPLTTWVNHPLAISAASYKPEQLARARRAGFAVPHSLITNNPQRAREFYHFHRGSVIAKPVGHGEIRDALAVDDRIVYANLVGPDLEPDFDLVANCPTFFQQEITKDADIRVTVFGSEVFGVALWSQEHDWSAVDCRRENMRGMRYEELRLPDGLRDSLVSLVQSYGLLFGAIDLIRDRAGKYWFLELNPAGQWAWLEQLGHGKMSDSLIRILSNSANTGGAV